MKEKLEEEFDVGLVLGVLRQLVSGGRARKGCSGNVGVSEDVAMKFWDDLSGGELEAEGAKKARAEEMGEFKEHGVYVKVPM